ncbi:hypothetical protein FACS189473_2520 [Spirochaetia bacterium]|nr:hypothetical protein FACS189473_2520 [Spirochaetia bacterium]
MNNIKSFIQKHFQKTFHAELPDEEYTTIIKKVNKVKWRSKDELSEKERFIKNKLREARKIYQGRRS